MSDTTVVTLPAGTVLASLKQTGHVPGWVTDDMTVATDVAPDGGVTLTITGEAPIAPAPEPAPAEG